MIYTGYASLHFTQSRCSSTFSHFKKQNTSFNDHSHLPVQPPCTTIIIPIFKQQGTKTERRIKAASTSFAPNVKETHPIILLVGISHLMLFNTCLWHWTCPQMDPDFPDILKHIKWAHINYGISSFSQCSHLICISQLFEKRICK